jgi:hypothetical protein
MLDHNAIIRAYPHAVSIDDGTGAFDKDGNSITLEQSKIDAARTTLDAEAAAVKYKTDRTTNGETTYPAIGDQLDLLWHAIDADADLKSKFSTFYNSIKAVKDANPKP